MIFRFIKPWEEACKDYLQGIDRAENRAVIIENLRLCDGRIESNSYKVRLYYSGSYEKIRITRKEGF